VAFVSGRQTEWLDYLPSPVLALKATTSYCAVGMEDGTVNVYSQNGRRYSISTWFLKLVRELMHFYERLMPTLMLDSPCAVMEGSKHVLLVITTNGQVYSW